MASCNQIIQLFHVELAFSKKIYLHKGKVTEKEGEWQRKRRVRITGRELQKEGEREWKGREGTWQRRKIGSGRCCLWHAFAGSRAKVTSCSLTRLHARGGLLFFVLALIFRTWKNNYLLLDKFQILDSIRHVLFGGLGGRVVFCFVLLRLPRLCVIYCLHRREWTWTCVLLKPYEDVLRDVLRCASQS